MRTAIALLVLLVGLSSPRLTAQVAGAYPHLVLTDAMGQTVPGAGGPFDNTGVFQAFSGISFAAHVSYASAGQSNTNVLWALLISASKTPFPLNTLPPQLLTQPPFIFVQGVPPTLDGTGAGTLSLFVPSGVYAAQAYVQALVYDVTSSPKTRLTNGLTLKVQLPDYNVHYTFVRSKPAGGDGQLGDVGTIDIDGNTLKTLKPIGSGTPPPPTPDAAPLTENFRFLPIAPNNGDEPVNPRARPFTHIVGSIDTVATTFNVEDTAGFATRGRIMVPVDPANGTPTNLWTKPTGAGDSIVPPCEVVSYDGITPTSFLNCKRVQLGSKALSGQQSTHVSGQVVLGFFTEATTSGANARTRVSLDVENIDMPHVVIPQFTFDAGEGGGGTVTRDLDVYIYETLDSKRQGFMTFDRVTGQWRAIPGTEFGATDGTWEPMLTVAPDGRSLVAVLDVPGGVFNWDNKPNRLFAIRLDGLHWPGSGAEAWELTWQVAADPSSPPPITISARSRRPWTPAMTIVGNTPENFVLYAGLAHKWAYNTLVPGANFEPNNGLEAEYVNEETIVRDIIECPLVPPGSSKLPPTMPRPWITTDFGLTGFGDSVNRFDPDFLRSPDHTRLLVTGGPTPAEEDVFCIRNVSVTAGGNVIRTIANLSGYTGVSTGVAREVRMYYIGGHGQGHRAAFSPDGTRAVWLVRDKTGTTASNDNKDWIDIAHTNGADYGNVTHTYANTASPPIFKISGPLTSNDRAVLGLRFLDNNRLIFMMGRSSFDDPAGLVVNAPVPGMDLFLYDIPSDVMTNLTHTDGTANGFGVGKIVPAGYFASPDGAFAYVLRTGKLNLPAPNNLHVMNVFGVNEATANLFAVTGSEFGGGAAVPDLDVSPSDVVAPIESPRAMHFVEAQGVQDGLIYWSSQYAGGNGSDNVIALNTKTPFVAFAATNAATAGVHVADIVPDPYSGKVAFSRTDTAAKYVPNQHPFIVDLDNFLFERDLTPTWTSGGGFLGRVMGGSIHFIAPSGTAGDAVVFAFGLGCLPSGIATIATPAYYPLAAVSNLLAEPIPVLIPLVDTGTLGGDYRFYIPTAGPSQAP